MSVDVNFEPVLDGAIGPSVILVIVGVDDPFQLISNQLTLGEELRE
jgi:hypothetical protein